MTEVAMGGPSDTSSLRPSTQLRHTTFVRGVTALEPSSVPVLAPGFMVGRDAHLYFIDPASETPLSEAVGFSYFGFAMVSVEYRRNPAGPTPKEAWDAVPPELRPFVAAIEHPRPNFVSRSRGADGLLQEHFRVKLYKRSDGPIS